MKQPFDKNCHFIKKKSAATTTLLHEDFILHHAPTIHYWTSPTAMFSDLQFFTSFLFVKESNMHSFSCNRKSEWVLLVTTNNWWEKVWKRMFKPIFNTKNKRFVKQPLDESSRCIGKKKKSGTTLKRLSSTLHFHATKFYDHFCIQV